MIENTILNANRTGRKALVFSMTYKDLWAVEAAAQVGFDAVALDGEQPSRRGYRRPRPGGQRVRSVGHGSCPEHPVEHARICGWTVASRGWSVRTSRARRKLSNWPTPACSPRTVALLRWGTRDGVQ